jgi:probable phosphoglycerate mutase
MRHGTTDWNEQYKLQGRTDIPLNERGRRMAEQAAEEYRNVPFDICYCSPLRRAKETAEIVLKGRDVPIITDKRLMEMSFGIYEGIEHIFERPDCPVHVLFQKPECYAAVEGGESLNELYARTGEFMKEIAAPALEQGKDVLIVGHGAMNSSIICQIWNLPVEQFWSAGIEKCKLMKLQ